MNFIDNPFKRDLCAREPIHVPGSIQSHGLLLVVDAETGLILQTAGDARVVLEDNALNPGDRLAAVLEGRLEALLRDGRRELGGAPKYLGDVQASPRHPLLTVTAHTVTGWDVIEIEPAGPSSPAPAVLSSVRASIERMQDASGLANAARSIAADVRQLTGFDRVMIYQFMEDASGSVIAEDKLDDLPAFLHHRYPASDVPPQARELYRRNPIRVIPDVTYTPSPLVPTRIPGTEETLDMSHCTLRSVSPVHLQYLRNMGVGASMSVSILSKGELWGLIACHHGGPRLVPFEIREVCQHLGQALSRYIDALVSLSEWVLQTAQRSGTFATDCLSEHYPPARHFAAEASGLLAVVLPGDRPLVIMWIRAEQVEEVLWAGNPHEAVQLDEPNDGPNPRKSFALWAETVRGRSSPWSRVEVEAAHLLRARAALVLQDHRIRQLNTQIQSANERLSALARTDDLTGLANRRALGERLTEEWARVARYGRSLAAMAIDIDHFKEFNDQFGHPAGDECLRKVATVLGAAGRATDFSARSGGEEFVILLPATDLAGAQAVAEDVRAAIERLRIRHPASATAVVTASVGVAATTANFSGTPESLLHEADTALYSAKRGGRNRVAVASPRDLT